MNAILATVLLAVTVGGCQDRSLRELEDVAVGKAVPLETAPVISGTFLMAWLCDDHTIIANGLFKPDECKNLEFYTMIYRDSTWQYAVEVRRREVSRITKYRLDAWP